VSRHQPFYKALRKYGVNSFEVCTLAVNLDSVAARELETVYIKVFDSEQRGYNRIAGGSLGGNNKGKVVSPETKKKMSESHKKRAPHANSILALKKLGKSRIGVKVSLQEKQRLSKFNESRKKSIVDNLGRKYSSISEAADMLNLHVSNISDVLRGVLKTTGGYKFYVCGRT